MEGVLNLGARIFICFYVTVLVASFILQGLAGLATILTMALGFLHWL